jgi:hypothetical protein
VQNSRRVIDEHQHDAPDGSVELAVKSHQGNVPGTELDVPDPGCGPSPLRNLERRLVDIDTHDRALLADNLAHEERHVSDTTTDVEDVHPGTGAG